MLELPEEVPDYDYGLKLRSNEEQRQVDNAVAGISGVGSSVNINNKDLDLPGPSGINSKMGSSQKGTNTQPVPEAEVDKTESNTQEVGKIELPADAFHMVTQLNWEEDVIWNGEDIKHKVLSKLNSKSNAAGWVPSSMSRTAGSFSQRPGVKPELQIRYS